MAEGEEAARTVVADEEGEKPCGEPTQEVADVLIPPMEDEQKDGNACVTSDLTAPGQYVIGSHVGDRKGRPVETGQADVPEDPATSVKDALRDKSPVREPPVGNPENAGVLDTLAGAEPAGSSTPTVDAVAFVEDEGRRSMRETQDVSPGPSVLQPVPSNLSPDSSCSEAEVSKVTKGMPNVVLSVHEDGGVIVQDPSTPPPRTGPNLSSINGRTRSSSHTPPLKIKDEPVDEEYDCALGPQQPLQSVKDEPDFPEELSQQQKSCKELRISAVFSVGGNAAPAAPTSITQPANPQTARPSTAAVNTPPADLSSVPAASAAPPVAPLGPPTAPPASSIRVSCCGCKKVLMKGQTAFQRKGSSQLFCSTICLTSYNVPSIQSLLKKTCHSCWKEITNPKDVIIAPVDAAGTMKDFCSQSCLSEFDVKRKVLTTVPPASAVANEGVTIKCSVCQKTAVIRHEVNYQGVVHKLCSDGCFSRFRSSNKLTMNCCDTCGGYCYSGGGQSHLLQIEGATKKFCSPTCLTAFKQKSTKVSPCAMCFSLRSSAEMVESVTSQGMTELFCSTGCVTAYRVQSVRSSGTAVQCNQCKVTAVPQYHLAMSDSSMRSFCCYSCVIGFQTDFNKLATQAQMSVVPQMAPAPAAPATPAVPTVTVTQPPPAPSTVAPDAATPKAPPLIVSLSPSTRTVVRLTCRHCSRLFASKPELFQFKGEMIQFCGKTCAEEFKKVNLVMARCEYCKIDKILKEVKKINHQDCSFCSEGCKLLYKHDLAKRWGRHCQSCAYCSNTSQRVVQNHFAGKLEEFCGDACMSQYTVLFYQMSRCDTCRRQGKLIESLQWLGEMKHFCNLQCLLQFCSQQSPADAQLTMAPLPVALAVPSSTVPTMPSPSSLASKEATPVIANVVSLASTPMGQPSMCANATLQGTIPMAPAKVTGHASTQTDTLKLPPAAPRILKNKALLCKPMNLNKGTICKPHTQSAHTQTEEEPSRVFVLTVPVPVFVPVPLHLYTQLTPVPVGIPVPVPMFLPAAIGDTRQHSDANQEVEGKTDLPMVDVATHREAGQDRGKTEPDRDQGSSFSGDQESASVSSPRRCGDEANGSNGREGGTPTDATSLTQLLDLEAEYPADLLVKGQKVTPKPRIRRRPRDGFPPRKRGRKRAAAVSTTPSEELPPSGGSKLLHMYGVGAWKRWVQQRDKQPNTETPGFNRQPVGLKQDLLQCSPAELSCGLSLFVSEVRRPSGVPYNPDSIFYLCLGIQQYLLENGRVENIFTDELYSGFVEQLTKMLRDWKPPILPNGYLHSRVEEEHLWVCKQLGDHSPAVLLNTLLFFTTKLFHLKTPSQHGCLSFAHVLHRTRTLANNRNGKFLHFCLPVEKRQDRAVVVTLGKRKMEEEEVMEIPENLEDPLRCPVRLYEFYLSKCPDSVKQRTDVFYLQPECPWVPDCPLWFSSRPLESSTLEAMLTRILSVRELQQDGVQAPPLASLSDKEASE